MADDFDILPEWIAWRRAELEDSTRRIFNVSRTHRCWENDNCSDTMVVNRTMNLHGCLVCGRLHHCRANAAECPLVQNPDNGSYVCAFTGRELADPDPITGTYDAEVLANSAGHVTTSAHSHTTSAHSLRNEANRASDANTRKRKHVLADTAGALAQSMARAAASSRGIALFEPFIPGAASHVTPLATKKKHSIDGGDESGSGGDRRTSYSKEETTRDCDFQARFFADMALEMEYLRPLFVERAVPDPQSSLSLTEDSPVQRKHSTLDGSERLRRTLRHIMQAIEILAATRQSDASQAWPPFEARLDYYLHVSACLMEVVLGKKLEAILDSEMQKHAAIFLLDVLATTMSQRDSFGAQLIIWAADPWLEWCKTGLCLTQLIGQYDVWLKKTTRTYADRLGARGRKRKRSDGSQPGPIYQPFDEETRTAMDALPSSLYSTLVSVAANISHQGNLVRTRLIEHRRSPIALYATVHASLLERRPQYRKRPTD